MDKIVELPSFIRKEYEDLINQENEKMYNILPENARKYFKKGCN